MAAGVVAALLPQHPVDLLKPSVDQATTSTANGASTRHPPELVLPPNTLTTDLDPFRFSALSAAQLAIPPFYPPNALSTHLISSPYNLPSHTLDLATLPTASLLLAKSLAALRPARPDYATAPYHLALTWPAVLATLRALCAAHETPWPADHEGFYVVVFRSRLKADADKELLYDLDRESHREATVSGGLLKYWFGAADEEGRNLATCLWHSRDDARRGGTGPWHKKARAAASVLYESIKFTTLRLVVGEGAGELRIEEWVE